MSHNAARPARGIKACSIAAPRRRDATGNRGGRARPGRGDRVAKGRDKMEIELHAPSMVVLVGSLFLAFFALIGFLLTPIAIWLAFVAYVVLAFGTIVKTA